MMLPLDADRPGRKQVISAWRRPHAGPVRGQAKLTASCTCFDKRPIASMAVARRRVR
jgi:hypothetical protein